MSIGYYDFQPPIVSKTYPNHTNIRLAFNRDVLCSREYDNVVAPILLQVQTNATNMVQIDQDLQIPIWSVEVVGELFPIRCIKLGVQCRNSDSQLPYYHFDVLSIVWNLLRYHQLPTWIVVDVACPRAQHRSKLGRAIEQ